MREGRFDPALAWQAWNLVCLSQNKNPSHRAPEAGDSYQPPPPRKGASGKISLAVIGEIVFFLIIGSIFSDSDDDKPDNNSASSSSSSSSTVATPNRPQKPDATFSTAPGPDGDEVTAVFTIKDNFTEGLIKDGARFDTIDILKYAKATYPNAASVNVQGKFPMKDAYGNTRPTSPRARRRELRPTSDEHPVFRRYQRAPMRCVCSFRWK